jgi:hypothetical protein
VSDPESQLLEDKAVLPLELFFDLVFVLGITHTAEDHPKGRMLQVGFALPFACTHGVRRMGCRLICRHG